MAFSTNFLLFVIFLNRYCLAAGHLHFSTWSKINFSQSVYVFETRVGQSVQVCVKTCKAKNMCKYINYQRQSRTCFLIGVSNPVGISAIANIDDSIESKRGYVVGKKQKWNLGEYTICEECNPQGTCSTDNQQFDNFSICQDSGCVLPEAKERALIRGNMFSIGDKIKYECEDGFTAMDNSNVTATCQPSGYWSASEIKCIPESASRTCFEDSCYLFVETYLTWNRAREHCISLGGLLVYIKTEEEWEYLTSTVLDLESDVWLGADDTDIEGTFKWQDGTSVSSGFKNWRPGEPNTNGGDPSADCVISKLDNLWNDARCGRQSKSVCKFS